MSDDKPTVPLLVYLHADKLISKHSRLTDCTPIPCSDHEVQTEALAILLLSSAFWSLRRQGLIDFEVVDHPHARWISHHAEVKVILLQRSSRPGLEGAMIETLEGSENLRDLVWRWLESHSLHPWHDVVDAVVAEAVAAGYLREVRASRGVIARLLLGGSELEPDCERVAGSRRPFDAFIRSWQQFQEQERPLYERLTEQCRRSLLAGTEYWYA